MASDQPTRRQALKYAGAALSAPVLAAPMLASGAARAQSAYPARPVKVVVPYSPGGGADTVSRILFAKLSEQMGQQFVIDNRGGGGATIGPAIVAKSEADGYTLLHDGTAFSINPSLYQRLSYDYGKDFTPVFLASLVTNFFLLNNSVEAKTVADVIAMAKSTPTGLDFASSGNGSVQHLCLEMFRHMTGGKINHIPYRGGGPALNDLIAGQVKFFFSNGASSIGHVRAGTLKAIAHTGRGRLPSLPDLPTMSETLPGFEAYEWKRRIRADRHAARNRRQAQCGAQRGAARAGHPRAAGAAQRRISREQARPNVASSCAPKPPNGPRW